jgi:ribonucleotide monophosphatase NagD (HAD superfamily)
MTNNGKVTEQEFTQTMNDRFNSSLNESQIILCHTPLRGLAHEYANRVVLTTAPDELGSAKIATEYGFKQHVNLIEYLCVYPKLASLTL